MKKIFFFLLTSLSLFGSYQSYAVDENNVNSQNFMVNIGEMDPLKGSHAGASVSGPNAFFALIGTVTDMLLILVPILAGVSLLIAGYFYIFSAGDSEKAGRAKTIIKWNIIAIFISFFSYAIVKIVASFFY